MSQAGLRNNNNGVMKRILKQRPGPDLDRKAGNQMAGVWNDLDMPIPEELV